MADQIDFYQICYREEQRKECYPFAKVYFNEELTPFFENAVIRKLVLLSESEKISVCSWKLSQKIRWNVCMPRPLTEDILKTDFEVMSFTCNTKYHQFLNAAEKWHPGFIETMKLLLSLIEKPMPLFVKSPIYQNHFCARADIYKKYVNEYLSPAMEAMSMDGKLKDLCWKDSNYSQLAKRDAASSEILKEKIGVSYYPMHAFILERLFSIFCQDEGIKVTYL